jgi:hypothetical protein
MARSRGCKATERIKSPASSGLFVWWLRRGFRIWGGRASISVGEFSRKWHNALRVNNYPPQGDSLRPEAFIFHKIRYAGVFEESDDWRKPLLWLPLPSVPLRRGARSSARSCCGPSAGAIRGIGFGAVGDMALLDSPMEGCLG